MRYKIIFTEEKHHEKEIEVPQNVADSGNEFMFRFIRDELEKEGFGKDSTVRVYYVRAIDEH